MSHFFSKINMLFNNFRESPKNSFQVLRFLFVGGLSFVVDFGALWILHIFFGINPGIASVIAFLLSFFVNFFLQKLFTFQSAKRTKRALTLYIILAMLNTLATGLIVGFLSPIVGWVTAKLISVILISCWNFFAYKYFVFPPNQNPKN